LLSSSEQNPPAAAASLACFQRQKSGLSAPAGNAANRNQMKKNRLIPLILLLLLLGIAAFSLVIEHSKSPTAPAPAASTQDATPTALAPAVNTSTTAAPTEPPVISNLPPSTTTVKAVAAPEIVQETPAPTLPATKPAPKIVEMPATAPTAPTNFYSGEMAAQHAVTNQNYYFRTRAGYQHTSFGGNNDTYWLSLKFYAHGDQWRQNVGKNAWLVPDITAEASHQDVPKNQSGDNTGTAEGLHVEATLFWPWFNWAMKNCCANNPSCPLSGPVALAFGPTANGGFDQLFNAGSVPTAFYHSGARLTLNRDAYLEYTVGGAQNLPGTRQQLAVELPLYQSRNGEVHYVVRGLWDHVGGSHPDLLQGAFFVEMPFDFLTTPSKWSSLIPFTK
jgi:hypothetical protein